MSQTIKARPTVYEGIKMRSRLEAAFAQWLDANNPVGWEYEPSAYGSVSGQYLPDFVVPGTYPNYQFFEVKPNIDDGVFDDALSRMHIILASQPNADLFVVSSNDYSSFFTARACTTKKGCGQCERGRSGALWTLLDREEYSHDESRTVCGQCGDTYTHLSDVSKNQLAANCRRDDHSALELTFWCEHCDFHTIWNIHNHKGETLASFRTSPVPAGEEEERAYGAKEPQW
jgi:hypothetical protein